MKVFLLANSIVGLRVAQCLHKHGDEIVGLCLHEPKLRRFGEEIKSTVNLSSDRVFSAKQLKDVSVLKAIRELNPDIGVAAFWAYILKPSFFEIPNEGTINLHPGYLPYCRGKNPNVWPFLENCPAGVTIHYIDEGIDTGDIIARKEVPILPSDTAGDLYERTLVDIVSLFEETWPKLREGKANRVDQSKLGETPSFHLGKEIDQIDQIDLNKSYSGRELINLLKARTYKDRLFAYYEENGRKVRVGIRLLEEDESSSPARKTS